jgi:hypothetical protein
MTAGLTVVAVSVVRIIMGVVARTFILIRSRGGGLWILGAISPVQCAAECGWQGADVVSHHMGEWAGSVERVKGPPPQGEPGVLHKKAERSAEKCNSGQATPAALRGSGPRMIIFHCAAEINQSRKAAYWNIARIDQ